MERQATAQRQLRKFGSIRINPWLPPLALVAIAVVLILVEDVPDPVSLALAAASSLVALLGAIQSVAQGLRPVAASFYIFWFSWLGIGPIAQMTVGKVAWGDSTVLAERGQVQSALALTLLAIAAFWAGDHWARSRPPLGGKPAPRATIRPGVQVVLSVALIGVGLNAIRVLGLSSFFIPRQDRSEMLIDTVGTQAEVGGAATALYTVLPSALAVTVTLLAVYRIQINWRGVGQLKAGQLVHLAIGALGIAVFANPLSQTRFVALLAIGSLLIVLLRPRSSRAGFVYLAIGLVGTLLIYPLANAFRTANATVSDITSRTFTGADFDGFQQVVNAMNYVESVGWAWGHHIVSAVLFFVPRSLWQDKADPASLEVAAFAGYRFTNLSLPIHAELYMQLGLLGVAMGMLGIGFTAGRLDAAWLGAPLSKMAMIAPVAALATFGVLRGPLGAQVPVWLPIVLLLLLAVRSGDRKVVDTVPRM